MVLTKNGVVWNGVERVIRNKDYFILYVRFGVGTEWGYALFLYVFALKWEIKGRMIS